MLSGTRRRTNENAVAALANLQGPESVAAKALTLVAQRRAAGEDVEILVDRQGSLHVGVRNPQRERRETYVALIFALLVICLFAVSYLVLTAFLPSIPGVAVAVTLTVCYAALMIFWRGQYAVHDALYSFLFEDGRQK